MEAAVNEKFNIDELNTTNSSHVKVVVKLKSKASLQTFITNISSVSLIIVMTDHMTHNVKALFLTESHSTNKNVPSSE
jgi:hypothetical protein